MKRLVAVAVVIAVASMSFPAAAGAGVYVVNSCNGNTTSTQGWERRSDARTALLAMCLPASAPAASPGMLLMPPMVSEFIGAGLLGAWYFDAPEGTKITGVYGAAQGFATPGELVADVSGAEFGAEVASLAGGAGAWRGFSVSLPSTASAWIRVRCGKAACWLGPPTAGALSLKDLMVSIRDDRPPAIGLPSGLDGWHGAGVVPIVLTAADNVGISDFRASLAGTELMRSNTPCYFDANSKVRPCADANTALRGSIDTSSLSNGAHVVTVRATDPGRLVTERTFTLHVDRIPPGSPRRLSVAGGERWRAKNVFEISWTNPPTAGTAPIASVDYAFCPASNTAYEAAGCVRESRALGAAETDTVAVPADGVWTLRVGLRDAAGNTDPNQIAVLEPLRLDREPPTGAILPLEPTDPTRIRVSGEDATSGFSRADIEIRRVGDDAWRALVTRSEGGTFSAVADDSALPGGDYEIRARVFDHAGNERTLNTDARLRLPVRAGGTLTAGRSVRERVASRRGKTPTYRTKLVDSMTVGFGTAVAIEGSLLDSAGNARVDAPLDVQQMDGNDGGWRQIHSLRTGASGTFRFQSLAGASRRLKIVFAGTPTERPLTKEIDIRVRAGITIRPDRRRVRNGQQVVFRGTLRGAPVPEAGKLLSLQALTSRGWQTFATPRARAKDGRWRSRYRFTGTSVRTRYAFRVVAPAESGYPYERGDSPTVRVLVTP